MTTSTLSSPSLSPSVATRSQNACVSACVLCIFQLPAISIERASYGEPIRPFGTCPGAVPHPGWGPVHPPPADEATGKRVTRGAPTCADSVLFLPQPAAPDTARGWSSAASLGRDRSDPRELLALEQLERRPAAGGHPRDPVGEPELLHGAHRVAAAHDRERLRGRDRLCHRPRARRERLPFEHAHRA